MKKIMFFLLCVFALNVNAQNDSLSKKIEMKVGFMLSPQGKISLKNPSEGSSLVMPFFVLFSTSIGNWSVTPIYSLGDNYIGGFIDYAFPNSGMYLVATKGTKTSDCYLGIGGGVPVANGRASAFIETGSSWKEWDPYFFIGTSIPLTFRVRR